MERGVRKILYGRYCIFRSDACIQNRFTLCGRDHSVDFCKKPKIVKIFGLINAIIVDAFAIFLGSQGWKVCTKMLAQGKQSPMMRIPLGAVYMIIPVGIILMAVFYTISAVSKFRDNTEEKEEN